MIGINQKVNLSTFVHIVEKQLFYKTASYKVERNKVQAQWQKTLSFGVTSNKNSAESL